MRPRNGILECIRCSGRGKARTVHAKGRSIRLGEGQAALQQRAVEGVEPTLAPAAPTWRPAVGGSAHPRLGLFPHDEMRRGQTRFARDVTSAVAKRRHLVAQAPTGIGKTAAVLAPALRAAIDNGKTVFFLTSRQSQHRIAIDTLRKIQELRGARFGVVDLVAKRDMCLRVEASEMHPARFPDFCARETRTRSCRYLRDVDEDILAQMRGGVLHVEELMHLAKQHQICPHLAAMEAAPDAQVVVADYNHLFSDIREQSLERLGLELGDIILVVDEAHNLPDRIRQNHAHRITDFLLDQVKAEARGHRMREVIKDCDTIREALIYLADAAQRNGRAEQARMADEAHQVARLQIDDLHRAFENARNTGTLGLRRTLQDAIEDLLPLVKKVRAGQQDQVFAEQLQEALDDWGRFRNGALRYVEWDEAGGISLHVRLLDPSIPARRVFEAVHSTVLMSGTLRPPEMFRDLLGLDEQRTTVREYDSPFPPEHRPLIIGRGFTTRYKARGEAMWNRMAQAIADTATAATGNIAVFAPSYSILRDVRLATQRLDHGKLDVLEEQGMPKAERDRILDTLRGAVRPGANGAILWGVLGGSFSEGVDFSDNLLQAVVLLGLPLAPRDLEVDATVGYMDARFPGKGDAYAYTYPAMQKALQAMGRGIRSPTDKCAVILLDERYLMPRYAAMLPAQPIPSTDPAFTAASFLVHAHPARPDPTDGHPPPAPPA